MKAKRRRSGRSGIRDPESRSWDRRARAVEAVADRPRSQLLGPLRKALHDREPLVAIAALEVVEARGLRELAPSVRRLLRADDALLRGCAAHALGRLGLSLDRLTSMYSTDRSDTVRVRIAASLARRDRAFAWELLGFLWAPDYRVRCTALHSIAERKRAHRQARALVEWLARNDPTRAVRTTAAALLRPQRRSP